MAERSRLFLITASILFILVGLARGAGGVALLWAGGSSFAEIHAEAFTVRAVGWGLLAVAAALIGAGLTAIARRRFAWPLGLASAVAFPLNGLLNGYLLFGSPRLSGTLVNTVLAALLLVLLAWGRAALLARR